MATSGTATFNLDLVELVEEAFERAGGEVRSGYDLRTARRSLNLLLADWANRGLNLWTFEEGSVSLVAGTATYALPADTVDIIEHVLRTGSGASQSDMTMTRTSVSTYAAIPNKLATGRPLQLLVTRTATPTVTVWPVPDGGGPYTLRYWRLRRLQDAGTGVQTQDVPFRFLPALVAALAPCRCSSGASAFRPSQSRTAPSRACARSVVRSRAAFLRRRPRSSHRAPRRRRRARGSADARRRSCGSPSAPWRGHARSSRAPHR